MIRITMQGCAYIDGEFVAPEDAKISIFDWGFLPGVNWSSQHCFARLSVAVH